MLKFLENKKKDLSIFLCSFSWYLHMYDINWLREQRHMDTNIKFMVSFAFRNFND